VGVRVSDRDHHRVPLRGPDQHRLGELQREVFVERFPEGGCREDTTDVGSFAPNAWGLFDLHGNVWEWCADESAPYTRDERTDPVGKSVNFDDNSRVLRGGSWDGNPQGCRASVRPRGAPVYRVSNVGFRVCFRLD
jgi:formylglycine-generating enzyme required for sulfatase activity